MLTPAECSPVTTASGLNAAPLPPTASRQLYRRRSAPAGPGVSAPAWAGRGDVAAAGDSAAGAWVGDMACDVAGAPAVGDLCDELNAAFS